VKQLQKRIQKKPSLDSVVANNRDHRVVIGFDEKMDVETLTNYSNYLVNIDGQLRALTPDIADIDVLHDGQVVVVTFVEKLGGKTVSFAANSKSSTVTEVSEIHVLGVKDVAGNLLSNFTANNNSNKIILDDALNNNLRITEKTLVGPNTVELKFNAGIVGASNAAIKNITLATGQTVDSVEYNGSSVVKVHFNKNFKADASDVAFEIDPSELETLAGYGSGSNLPVASVDDEVSPSLVTDGLTVKATATDVLQLTFDENISDAALGLLASDLEIRVNGSLLNTRTDFTVSTGDAANDKVIEIKIIKNGVVAAEDVTVNLTNDRYIQDASGNSVNLFNARLLAGDEVTETVAPTVESAEEKSTTSVAITFSEKLDESTVIPANFTGTATPSAVSLSADGKTVTVTVGTMSGTETIIVGAGVKDLAGNAITAKTLTRGTDF